MTPLNQEAEKIFHYLIEGLKEPGDARKIDNTDGTYMPVSVDFVWWNDHGKIIAVAHNYIQNGDVMADPDMTFLVTEEQEIYPMTFQQDNLALYQQAIEAHDGESLQYDKKLQADLTSFANQWMQNIKDQQDLKLEPAPNLKPGPKPNGPSPF